MSVSDIFYADSIKLYSNWAKCGLTNSLCHTSHQVSCRVIVEVNNILITVGLRFEATSKISEGWIFQENIICKFDVPEFVILSLCEINTVCSNIHGNLYANMANTILCRAGLIMVFTAMTFGFCSLALPASAQFPNS